MRATVLANREFLPGYYRMRLRAPGLAPAFAPGQFVMVRPTAVGDPFLPRAFSIMRTVPAPAGEGHVRGDTRGRRNGGRRAAGGAELEIVYRALGRGTTLLAGLGHGNTLEFLGPLGHGFRLAPAPAVFVGGGVGIPPLVALAERLAARPPSPAPSPPRGRRGKKKPLAPKGREGKGEGALVLVGGKTRQDVLGVADFRRAGCSVQVATDDGSLGHHGLVTDLLEAWLAKSGNGDGGGRPTVYACGPEGMLKAVHRIALTADLPCQLSLEANMACGFGGCMGCAVPVRGEGMGAYKLCCKDGPVFDARELRW